MPNTSTDYLPYLFLAVMIIAGGIVAFVADGLGRKIGKKRLSFFGLRPRYTATLITVAAGVLIPILTIAATYLFSSEVREWIQKGRSAFREVQEKTEQVSHLNSELVKIESQRAAQENKVETLEAREKELHSRVSAQQRQLAEASDKIRKAQANESRLSQSVRTKEAELSKNTKLLADNTKQIVALKEQRSQIEDRLKQARGTNTELNTQRGELFVQLDKLNAEIAKLEGEAQALEGKTQQLTTDIAHSNRSIEEQRAIIQVQQNEIQANERQLDDLKGRLADASRLFGANFQISRMRPMIFEASEELARIQLPPSLSPTAARTAYFDLLQRARAAALAKKAINSPLTAPAGLTPRELNNRLVGIAEQEEAIIRGITAQRQELVFIARSFFNAFEGEYVLLDFIAYRNRLVYREGRVITEKRIDGRKSDVEVLAQIEEFISVNVRNQALKDGMIPPSGPSGQLGRIEPEELFNLIREAKSYNQLVRLQAVASSDTNAGDQLELLFRVRL